MLVSCLASASCSSFAYRKQPCLENVHAGNGSPLCCHTCSLSRSIPCTPRTSFPWRHMRKRSCCRSFRLIVVGRSESMSGSISWALYSTSNTSLCLWRTCEPWCMSCHTACKPPSIRGNVQLQMLFARIARSLWLAGFACKCCK